MIVWPCLLYVWFMNPKGAIRWKTRQRGSKKMLERLTEGPVDSGWHQPQTLGTACRNHAAWWLTTRRAAQDFEITRQEAAEESRRWRKEAQEQDPTGPTFLCPWCPRICLSRIGLISHPRACLPWQDLPTTDPWIWRNCLYHHQLYCGKSVCIILEIQFLRSCRGNMCPLEFPHYNAFYSEGKTRLLENIQRCYTTAQIGMHLVLMTN